MRDKLAKWSLPLRHSIVKLLAPRLYVESQYQVDISLIRPMTRFLSRYFGDEPLCGVEIGVAFGVNARSILESLNIHQLFLIDPYRPYQVKGLTHTPYVDADAYAIAQKRLSKFKDKVVFIRKTSRDAVKDVPNGVDFVYIDGDHAYNFVTEDIEKYYKKVKINGILGGHDFTTEWLGVIKAVTEFAQTHQLEYYADSWDWWIIKNE